jgi:hypothetical protein
MSQHLSAKFGMFGMRDCCTFKLKTRTHLPETHKHVHAHARSHTHTLREQRPSNVGLVQRLGPYGWERPVVCTSSRSSCCLIPFST